MEIQLNKDLQKFQDNFVLGLNFRQHCLPEPAWY